MLKILAIDLGNSCGIAHNAAGEFTAYTKQLASKLEVSQWGHSRLTRRDDPRVHRLAAHLSQFQSVDAVVFEDVEFSTYTKQTQLWSSLRTAVWLALGNSDRIMECVPVTTLKKFATGNHQADKSQMSQALKKRYPKLWSSSYDDNTIDAIWIHLWAQTILSRVAK